jgi:glyoxylase-like metal-dependent hydrolase (beta-lactamase superfamily II)
MTVLPWIVAAASVVNAPDPKRPGPNESYEHVQLAEGVHAFLAPEGRTGTVQGNSLVVIGKAAVLVVDTGQFPELTKRMIADIRKLTDRPVRYVVNTHWHGDHLLGNRTYREAFPGVSIVNHVETARLADKAYATFVEKSQKEFPTYVSDMRAAVARGTRKSGKALTSDEKEYFTRQANELEAAIGQLPQMAYLAPDVLFTQEVDFDLGGRQVRVLHLGRGNTGGDTVVFVPDAKVAAAGDLVVYPTPYSFGSWLEEWTATLGKLKALGASQVVPGHGPVLKDDAYVDTLIELIGETRRQVAAAAKEGLSLEDARKRVDLGRFRTLLAGDDFWRQQAFDQFFLNPAVGQAYKEAKGEPNEEGAEG